MTTIEYRSASDTAQYVEGRIADGHWFLRKSSTHGIEHLIREELAEVWEECCKPDWDGYGANAVALDSFIHAQQLLRSLPLQTKLPSIGAIPSGNISLEWHHSRRRSLTITITPCGDLNYAALLGADRCCGTMAFFDEAPEMLLDLIARVYS